MEQYRAPHAVCFLHNISPSQRKREENGKKQILIRGIVRRPVERCEYKGDHEIRDTVRAAPALRSDVLDLKRDVLFAAIDALARKLFEQVLPNLIARKLSLLVFNA